MSHLTFENRRKFKLFLVIGRDIKRVEGKDRKNVTTTGITDTGE